MSKSTCLLDAINSPADLRNLKTLEELELLAAEIRAFLVDTLSQIEHAHFSSNLGVVELTLALHRVFDTPNDALFWDIGHQGYVHKILTGRKDQLAQIRCKGGISGFLNRNESKFDDFGAGHAGTSISAALGAALASRLKGSQKHHLAVIGDASLGVGMAFEALNQLAVEKDLNLTIVINDNNCSIDPSVGGLSRYLNRQATSGEHTFFQALEFEVVGPVDGHDLSALLDVFQQCKQSGGVRIIHCLTQKGKGYAPSESGPAAHWHAPGKFEASNGFSLKEKKSLRYQDVFAQTLTELAAENSNIVAISAGMLSGTSLTKFQSVFPGRCFDVGIAEQHAVTLAAGLAKDGMLPYCAIYSTFLQRALDQVIHDVALQNLPVVFCVDRAGLVGHDGATHQGVFDISFLRQVPNLMIASPSNALDLRNLLFSSQHLQFPLVIRYPRGEAHGELNNEEFKPLPFGKSRSHKPGKDVMFLGLGCLVNELPAVVELLQQVGFDAGYCDMLFVKPLDKEKLHEIFSSTSNIVTLEEHALMGGFGSAVAEFMLDNNYKNRLLRLGIPDQFIEHASQHEQRRELQLDAHGIFTRVLHWMDSAKMDKPSTRNS